MKIVFIFLLILSAACPEQDLISANNLFTSVLYKETVNLGEKNFLVSPFSTEATLAFLLSGCKGDTAQEIQACLRLPNNVEKIENDFKTLLSNLKINESSLDKFRSRYRDEYYRLNIANKMYVQENFTIKDDFKKIASEIYQADLENVDFRKKTQAIKTINNWVASKTENKIQNIVDEKIIKNNTVLVLLNTVYFNATWENTFKPAVTQNFYKTAKDIVQVDTMHIDKLLFNYHEDAALNAKFVELFITNPNGDEETSMVVVLPNEKEGLVALENQIEKVFITPKWSPEYLNVALPKFKIESKINLKTILKNLGVNKAFNEEADFSGIAGKKGDIFVDKVLQKVFVDVNENGIEAATATALSFVPRLYISKAKDFIADHPFIFYIKVKNVILFAGRVLMPSQ